MRRAIPALSLTAAVTLGPSRAAVSARPATWIEGEVTDGVVSLRGHLPSRDESRLAVENARGVPGVRKVVDLLSA